MIADVLLRVLAAAVVGFAAGWLIKSVFARGRLRRAERSLQRQLQACKAELDIARNKAQTLKPRSRQLELRNQELEASFEKVNGELEQIRGSFAKREKSISELRAGLVEAQQNMEDVDRLRARLAAQDKKLKEMVGLRSELFERALHLSEMDSMKAELDTLSERATSLEAENERLHNERDKYDEALTLARERISSLEAALDQSQLSAPGREPEGDANAEQIAQLQERLKDRNAAVAEMRADLDRLTRGYQRRIRDLERKLGSRADHNISAMIDAEKPPTLSRFAKMEPNRVDDMTEISGIGPVLQQTLNGLGIHSYDQLARLTPADIERFGPELGPHKSRILREDWIGQAQRLHEQKYGSKVKH